MSKIKSVGIKDLKDNLSSYLKEVQSGTHILISDRSQIIAQITIVQDAGDLAPIAGKALPKQLRDWLISSEVTVRDSQAKPIYAPPKIPKLNVSAQQLLDEDRNEDR